MGLKAPSAWRGPQWLGAAAPVDNRATRSTRFDETGQGVRTSHEWKMGQGREAAPAGWCGPQRSEDTGQTGRTLDASGTAHAPGALPGM